MSAHLVEELVHQVQAAGPWAGVALAASTLVSEDLACLAGGALAAAGALGYGEATLACTLGIWLGDLGLYALGRIGGRLGSRFSKRLGDRAQTAAATLRARQGRALFAARFLPGTRLPLYLTAGALEFPLGTTAAWTALAAIVWTPLLVGAAFLLGEGATMLFESWVRAVPFFLLGALLCMLALKLARAASTWSGRRLLLGRWRRLTRWEYWPMWAVYPVVVFWILLLSLRARSPTWFTAVNPGLPAAGGLVGESKSEILRALDRSGRVAPWALLAPGAPEARLVALRAFLAADGGGYPVVLKPDVGERGSGVVIARTESEAESALRAEPAALIAQRYIAGVEFGVFYMRRPSEERGRIFAITEKVSPCLTGDGRTNLEHLILTDERAVNMAPFFLASFAARLEEVPASGARVPLTELGTHCRGSLFLDGARHETRALLEETERVSRCAHGFHFGRYDVRSPSVEAFRRGEFTVIELNGLTSEPTSIYDPAHSVWRGWATLCRMWTEAWHIARENRAEGCSVMTTRAVLTLIRKRP